MGIQTKCLNCGTILTDEDGNRVESAYADSSLPSRPMDDDVTWLRCGDCREVAKRRSRGRYTEEVGGIGNLMTVETWRCGVRSGCLTDDDGFGYPVKDGKASSQPISPSDMSDLPKDATHVQWFNR